MRVLGTIQHTGTWTLIGFFKEVCGLTMGMHHPAKGSEYPFKHDFMHMHLSNTRFGGRLGDVSSLARFKELAESHKAVIALRDPMRSIITRHNRHPELRHTYLPLAFDRAVDLNGMPNLSWAPLDLADDQDKRFALMRRLCNRLGVPITNDKLTAWARDWPKRNSTPDVHGLHKAYDEGDMVKVYRAFPEEANLLLTNTRLKTFLKEQGYDLPWFVHGSVFPFLERL